MRGNHCCGFKTQFPIQTILWLKSSFEFRTLGEEARKKYTLSDVPRVFPGVPVTNRKGTLLHVPDDVKENWYEQHEVIKFRVNCQFPT